MNIWTNNEQFKNINSLLKNIIAVKEILEDKYSDFRNKYWDKVTKRIHVQIDETVNKSIKYSDTKNGFAKYVCGESTKVPFICKSKFCNNFDNLYTIK